MTAQVGLQNFKDAHIRVFGGCGVGDVDEVAAGELDRLLRGLGHDGGVVAEELHPAHGAGVLAQQADEVSRVFCGIEQVLKGGNK